MRWCCWNADTADALMLLMRWCCWTLVQDMNEVEERCIDAIWSSEIWNLCGNSIFSETKIWAKCCQSLIQGNIRNSIAKILLAWIFINHPVFAHNSQWLCHFWKFLQGARRQMTQFLRQTGQIKAWLKNFFQSSPSLRRALGNTSHKKECFLLDIARIPGEGTGSCLPYPHNHVLKIGNFSQNSKNLRAKRCFWCKKVGPSCPNWREGEGVIWAMPERKHLFLREVFPYSN